MWWKTVADSLILRFHIESMEGGVLIAGSPLSSLYPMMILIFACCFLISGLLLTVLSYRPVNAVMANNYLRYLSGSHIAGPMLLVVGLMLLAAGLALRMISRRIVSKQTNLGDLFSNSNLRRSSKLLHHKAQSAVQNILLNYTHSPVGRKAKQHQQDSSFCGVASFPAKEFSSSSC